MEDAFNLSDCPWSSSTRSQSCTSFTVDSFSGRNGSITHRQCGFTFALTIWCTCWKKKTLKVLEQHFIRKTWNLKILFYNLFNSRKFNIIHFCVRCVTELCWIINSQAERILFQNLHHIIVKLEKISVWVFKLESIWGISFFINTDLTQRIWDCAQYKKEF